MSFSINNTSKISYTQEPTEALDAERKAAAEAKHKAATQEPTEALDAERKAAAEAKHKAAVEATRLDAWAKLQAAGQGTMSLTAGGGGVFSQNYENVRLREERTRTQDIEERNAREARQQQRLEEKARSTEREHRNDPQNQWLKSQREQAFQKHQDDWVAAQRNRSNLPPGVGGYAKKT